MPPAPRQATHVVLFFDCISPYTALALATLQRYRARWGYSLELVPMFLGGVMNSTGNKPPATLPQRAVFQAGDLRRNAGMFAVPLLDSPSNFFSEAARRVLAVQRVLVRLQMDGSEPATVERAADAFMFGIHCDAANRDDGNNVKLDDAFLLRCLVKAGLTQAAAADAVKRSGLPDTKAQLEANTNRAVEHNAFGSPTMLVYGVPPPYASSRDEPVLFFGSDRFEQLAFVLGRKYEGVNPGGARL